MNQYGLINVNGETKMFHRISGDCVFVRRPYYVDDVIAASPDSEMAEYPWLCPVGRIVIRISNIKFKHDTSVTNL